MVEREPQPPPLEELSRQRNRIAHELAYASESERVTQRYLAKELEMNAYTRWIDELRRASRQEAT